MHGCFDPTLINRVLKMHGVQKHSPSLSIKHPVIDRGRHTRKGIFPTVVKSFLRQGTRKTNGLFGIP